MGGGSVIAWSTFSYNAHPHAHPYIHTLVHTLHAFIHTLHTPTHTHLLHIHSYPHAGEAWSQQVAVDVHVLTDDDKRTRAAHATDANDPVWKVYLCGVCVSRGGWGLIAFV